MEGDETQASISFPDLAGDVQEGSTILLDDGLIELTVRGIRGGDIVCRVQNDGFISNNKGVNVPNVHLSMPFISERDREDIILAFKTASISSPHPLSAQRRMFWRSGRSSTNSIVMA